MIDTSIIEQGLESIVDDLENEDYRSKEYSQLVNTAVRLHNIITNEDELVLKKERAELDEEMRREELSLNKQKFDWEKLKWKADVEQREFDREVERDKIRNQHEERMAEIKVNQIKAENEKTILEHNQIKADREYKANRRRDWLIFGGKFLLFSTSIVLSVCMHKDELRFERDENGIVPKRCKTYDDSVTKMSEMILR